MSRSAVKLLNRKDLVRNGASANNLVSRKKRKAKSAQEHGACKKKGINDTV